MVAPSDRFVIHRDGGWALLELPGTSPEATPVAEVAALLATGPGADDAEPTDASFLRTTWGFVGALRDGRIHAELADGSAIELDRVDLEILGAATGGASIDAIASATGRSVDDVRRRSTRMIGRFLVPCGEDQLSAPAAEAVDHETVGPSPATPGPSDTVDAGDARIEVHTPWHDTVGPSLAMGMLTAAARAHDGGALGATYRIHRPEHADRVLERIAASDRPAIVLCSDYVWSLEDNLDLVRRAKRANPRVIAVHGGPSSPKYEEEAHRFLLEHRDAADILVRGEGEHVLCRLLEVLGAHLPEIPIDGLRSVPGLSVLDPVDDSLIRTPDQERIADLDALPSPYLTGEFDDIPVQAWQHCTSIETNRGCPYGCTFCDWGSSTMSRIRTFDVGRTAEEILWASRRGIWSLNIADANFGIMSRDVEIARRIGEARRRHGAPGLVSYYPAKNTTKHLAAITDEFLAAGVGPAATLSLQTTDPTTLELIERANISTDHYVALAAEYRRRGLPLQGDLLIGLPGQTYDSYRRDLQYHIDHEVFARTWQVRVLPNAPMNAPEYRARHGIETDAAHRVVSTSTCSPSDRARMMRLRTVDIIAERFGLLRHVMRYLQWDHGIEATELLDLIVRTTHDHPDRHPALTATFGTFDLLQLPAIGWTRFYDEVADLVRSEHGIDDDALDVVLTVQRHLMPVPGRALPVEVPLAHDYVTYYAEATAELWRTGHRSTPPRPLRAYPPGTLAVSGDPLGLCESGLQIAGDPRDPLFENDFAIGANSAYELASPLMRLLPHVAFEAREVYDAVTIERPPFTPDPTTDRRAPGGSRIPVEVRRRVADDQPDRAAT